MTRFKIYDKFIASIEETEYTNYLFVDSNSNLQALITLYRNIFQLHDVTLKFPKKYICYLIIFLNTKNPNC